MLCRSIRMNRVILKSHLFSRFLFYCRHLIFIAFPCCFQYMLYFCNRNNREVFCKQEETGKE